MCGDGDSFAFVDDHEPERESAGAVVTLRVAEVGRDEEEIERECFDEAILTLFRLVTVFASDGPASLRSEMARPEALRPFILI